MADEMSLNDREYFTRANQGDRAILELFHEEDKDYEMTIGSSR